RYQLDVGLPDHAGVRTVTLERMSQHKVAVSGFHPGKYPLLINDVGNGQHHLVRVTGDWGSLTYQLKVHGAQGDRVETIPFAKLKVDATMVAASVVVYEGSEEISLDRPDQQLFILDECQALYVPSK